MKKIMMIVGLSVSFASFSGEDKSDKIYLMDCFEKIKQGGDISADLIPETVDCKKIKSLSDDEFFTLIDTWEKTYRSLGQNFFDMGAPMGALFKLINRCRSTTATRLKHLEMPESQIQIKELTEEEYQNICSEIKKQIFRIKSGNDTIIHHRDNVESWSPERKIEEVENLSKLLFGIAKIRAAAPEIEVSK